MEYVFTALMNSHWSRVLKNSSNFYFNRYNNPHPCRMHTRLHQQNIYLNIYSIITIVMIGIVIYKEIEKQYKREKLKGFFVSFNLAHRKPREDATRLRTCWTTDKKSVDLILKLCSANLSSEKQTKKKLQ